MQTHLSHPKQSPVQFFEKGFSQITRGEAIIDGEIVCLDAQGVSQSHRLLNRRAEPIFRLVMAERRGPRNQTLTNRKKRLARLIRSADCRRILYAQQFEQYGKRFFEEVCIQVRALW
jgi:ATP-dependent DNA ligase